MKDGGEVRVGVCVFLYFLLTLNVFGQDWVWTKPVSDPGIFDTLVFSPLAARDSQKNIYRLSDSGLTKRDPDGKVIWSKPISCHNVRLFLSEDRVFAIGFFSDSIVIENHKYYTHNFGAYVGSWNLNGNFNWVQVLDKKDYSIAEELGLVSDENGNLYFAFPFMSTFSVSGINFTSKENHDIALIKFNKNGSPTWTYQVKGSGTEWFPKVGIDASGNIYLAGTFADSLFIGEKPYKSSGICGQSGAAQCGDLFLCKFNSSGQVLWSQAFGQKFWHDALSDMKVSSRGDIYFCSHHSDTLFIDNLSATGYKHYQTWIAKCNSEGQAQWLISSVSDNSACSPGNMLMFEDGSIFINGEIYAASTNIGQVIFGRDTLSTTTRWFVSKISDNQIQSVPENEPVSFSFSCFPNPFNKTLSIISSIKPAICNIHDIYGNLISERVLSEEIEEFDLENLASGLYIIELKSNSIIQRKKIVHN